MDYLQVRQWEDLDSASNDGEDLATADDDGEDLGAGRPTTATTEWVRNEHPH
jgi:hypothetical protein